MFLLRRRARSLVQDNELAVLSAATLATRCVHDADVVVMEGSGFDVGLGLDGAVGEVALVYVSRL
jgi:hypothetical protein